MEDIAKIKILVGGIYECKSNFKYYYITFNDYLFCNVNFSFEKEKIDGDF